ncbi:MAG: hypothetical protein IKN53_04325 [Oscillibacter sp.]|nr:hypothetical protein [Oscillibacter sp.]
MDQKERRKLSLTALLAFFSILVSLSVLSVATFAWFTNNRRVSTSRVEARTASADVSLLISQEGGSSFRAEDSCPIVQVNETDLGMLMPVSTDDLQTFLYNPGTVEDYAINFLEVEDEAFYFHGRVYLKAEASGESTGTHMALYLDQSEESGGSLVEIDTENGDDDDVSELVLNAARLGLSFGTGGDHAIFYLSDEHNAKDDIAYNTEVNGKILGDDMVLTLSGSNVIAVDDPAVSLDTYSMFDEDGSDLPDEPLFLMELNEIYPVDIYFYLEGCDPDCSDSISLGAVKLHLAFFGVLQ